MKQQTTPAIVLRRTNYGEADRIVTFLTPIGKIRAMVKGVRRSKSKLAGGIELFSENTITFLETRGDLARIVSTRLELHWDGIVGDLQRMMFGYEAMKLVDKVVEDEADRDYYELLKGALVSLNNVEIPLVCTEVWFYSRLLQLLGYGVNIKTTSSGAKLTEGELYVFDTEHKSFEPSLHGTFRAEHIKLLRLCLTHKPEFFKQVKQGSALAADLKQILLLESKQLRT